MAINPEIIGYAAAFFTTIAYIPQTLKVAREKHTASISIGMYALLNTGIALWCAYGWLIGSPSLIVCNGISLLMAGFILAMKIKHG